MRVLISSDPVNHAYRVLVVLDPSRASSQEDVLAKTPRADWGTTDLPRERAEELLSNDMLRGFIYRFNKGGSRVSEGMVRVRMQEMVIPSPLHPTRS